MTDATYNLPELVSQMHRGRVYWNDEREPYISPTESIVESTVDDVATINRALNNFYDKAVAVNIHDVYGEVIELHLDEVRGLLSFIYE